MSDKKHWIISIVPALAFAAGIIISSVGGIMTLSSSMKLALFDSEPYSIITEEQCRYDYNRGPILMELDKESTALGNAQQNAERSPEDIESCMNERRQEELTRFQNSQKRNIVDGVSSLLVGGILLLAFRRRKK